MKKLTLSLGIAGLVASSLGAYAATPTGAAPFQVMVPNLKSGFDFTLEGLYLQPNNSNLQYVSVPNGSNYSTGFNTFSLTPDYDFGFAVGVGYVFPNSGNDVRLNWTHFDQSTENSVFSGPGSDVISASVAQGVAFPFISPYDPIPLLNSTQTFNATSEVTFKYDAIDLDVAQYMSIGTRLQTRLFAGLRYANLGNDMTNTYGYADTAFPDPGSSLLTSGTYVNAFNSKFTGIGPRAGIDTSYHLGNCFGVTAHFSTALLVGRAESSTTQTTHEVTTVASPVETILIPPNALAATPAPLPGVTYTTVTASANNSFAVSNQTGVVPAFDAKLGLDYTLGFNNDRSHMVIEAGYQVTEYINAINRVHVSSVTRSGVGFNGPYLSLDLKM